MCLYTCLHGSYGLLWFMKHLAFADQAFEAYQTVPAALLAWASVLGPYLVPGFLLASGRCEDAFDPKTGNNFTRARVYVAIVMYIFGACLMTAADCQKNIILDNIKQRPVLIANGLFARTRNPNYLGEILLYLSFAMVTNHKYSYWIVFWAWGSIFALRIAQKELSLRQKPGFWEHYVHKSNIMLPKVFGDFLDTIFWLAVVYGLWRLSQGK